MKAYLKDPWLYFWIVISELAGVLGAFFTTDGMPWYDALVKPLFTPPGWLFGPVWTTLYLLMGIAAYIVWKQKNRAAITAFSVQLALNLLWTVLFFGMRLPGTAFIEIVVLLLAIATTIALFWKTSRAAGALLIPYIIWVTFAAVLNYSLWQLNL